jgi:hypothetical protein
VLLQGGDSLVQALVGRVRVVAPESQLAFGISLAEAADRPAQWPGLGRRPPPPFRLVIAPDSISLARIGNGRAPGWGAGITIPSIHTIVVRSDLDDVALTLRHEVAHLVLHDAVPGRVPLWFDEGYASLAAGDLERLAALQLNLAVASGQLPTLEELNRLLRGSARTADAGYGLAASAVADVETRQPPGGLERLFAHLEAGEAFDASLEAATGLTPDRFEDAWHQDLRRRYGLLSWLLAGGVWAVVATLLGFLVWIRRRADIPRRRALDEGWVVPEQPPPGPPVDQPGLLH